MHTHTRVQCATILFSVINFSRYTRRRRRRRARPRFCVVYLLRVHPLIHVSFGFPLYVRARVFFVRFYRRDGSISIGHGDDPRETAFVKRTQRAQTTAVDILGSFVTSCFTAVLIALLFPRLYMAGRRRRRRYHLRVRTYYIYLRCYRRDGNSTYYRYGNTLQQVRRRAVRAVSTESIAILVVVVVSFCLKPSHQRTVPPIIVTYAVGPSDSRKSIFDGPLRPSRRRFHVPIFVTAAAFARPELPRLGSALLPEPYLDGRNACARM